MKNLPVSSQADLTELRCIARDIAQKRENEGAPSNMEAVAVPELRLRYADELKRITQLVGKSKKAVCSPEFVYQVEDELMEYVTEKGSAVEAWLHDFSLALRAELEADGDLLIDRFEGEGIEGQEKDVRVVLQYLKKHPKKFSRAVQDYFFSRAHDGDNFEELCLEVLNTPKLARRLDYNSIARNILFGHRSAKIVKTFIQNCSYLLRPAYHIDLLNIIDFCDVSEKKKQKLIATFLEEIGGLEHVSQDAQRFLEKKRFTQEQHLPKQRRYEPHTRKHIRIARRRDRRASNQVEQFTQGRDKTPYSTQGEA